MKKYILAIVAASLSIPVFASENNFTGLAEQIAVGWEHSNSSIDNILLHGDPTLLSNTNASGNDLDLNIGIGYTLAMSNRSRLGATIEYNPFTTNIGQIQQSNAGIPIQNSYQNIILQNQYSVSLVPGYVLCKSSLAYLKISYVGTKLIQEPINNELHTGRDLDGYGIGIGYKLLFYRNLYSFVESNYKKYSDKNAVAPNQNFTNTASLRGYNALVGIGYEF